MKQVNDAEHLGEVVNAGSTPSPIDRDLSEEELRLCECELPHFGLPHSAVDETEDEKKSRLSAQRIKVARSRLLPDG
ncbi:hypothetical protein [Endozoicomonas ascidiicola]|uniref:hypothetical protein n=1 Tax=Endozoicomonas ascidiicola TaxID=1698521 RepID=UPI00082F509E|nr:hypothetical protein [Endozoicomonas ascidiicola]